MTEKMSPFKELLLSANITDRDYFINSSSKMKMEQLIESKIQLLNSAKIMLEEIAAEKTAKMG